MKRKIMAIFCSAVMLASMTGMAFAETDAAQTTGSDNTQTQAADASQSDGAETTTSPEDASARDQAIVLTIDEITAYVYGEKVENYAPPFILDGRTMVPVRFIAENMGRKASWNQKTAAVTIGDVSENIVMVIGSDSAKINGEDVKLDVPPLIKNDRTFVPIRFVSESLGLKVDWDAANRQVIISKPTCTSLDQLSDDELKHQLVEANRIDDILDKYGWVTWNRSSIGGEEKTVVGWDYYDIYDKEESITDLVDVEGDVYGIENGNKITYVFDEESYDYYTTYGEHRRRNLYTYAGNTQITERVVEDGVLTVREEITAPFSDSVKEALDSYNGIEADTLTKIEDISRFDADSLQKLSTTYLAYMGDEVIEFSSEYFEYGTGQPPEVDDSMYDEIFGGQTHTITIVTGVGTDHQMTYIKNAASDVFLDVWVADSNGDYDLYTDPECTQPYEEELVPFTQDITLYMK